MGQKAGELVPRSHQLQRPSLHFLGYLGVRRSPSEPSRMGPITLPSASVFPFHELHYHTAGPVLTAYIVEDADVRVIERGNCTCFTFESCTEITALCDVFRQNFHRHCAVEAGIPCFVHFTHATSPSGATIS